jgi:hypothetical protein
MDHENTLKVMRMSRVTTVLLVLRLFIDGIGYNNNIEAINQEMV